MKPREITKEDRARLAKWLDMYIGIYFSSKDCIVRDTLGEHLSFCLIDMRPDWLPPLIEG